MKCAIYGAGSLGTVLGAYMTKGGIPVELVNRNRAHVDALREKGYNPINQIVGYLLSEDPTYITTHNNARTLIRKIDRDELMRELVRSYLNN